ncbi:hypothetical protein FKM82_009880 [Ascaphus truei]
MEAGVLRQAAVSDGVPRIGVSDISPSRLTPGCCTRLLLLKNSSAAIPHYREIPNDMAGTVHFTTVRGLPKGVCLRPGPGGYLVPRHYHTPAGSRTTATNGPLSRRGNPAS